MTPNRTKCKLLLRKLIRENRTCRTHLGNNFGTCPPKHISTKKNWQNPVVKAKETNLPLFH